MAEEPDKDLTREEVDKIKEDLSEEDLEKLASGGVSCKSIYNSAHWSQL